MYIQIISLVFVFQSFIACQQGQEKIQPAVASVGSSSVSDGQQEQANLSEGNTVFQSVDGGATWQDISEGLPSQMQVGSILAAGNEIFLGADSGLYRRKSSIVGVQVWEQEISLQGRVSDIFPGRAGMYACNYGIGFFQNLATGSWKPMGNALKDKTVRTVFETPGGVLFVGCDSGIFRSSDSGTTWKLVLADVLANSILASGDVLICGSSKGLLRSTDGGDHWDWALTEDGQVEKIDRIDGHLVAITRGIGTWKEVDDDPEGMANRLRTSSDDGKTWQRMDSNLAQARLVSDMNANFVQSRLENDINVGLLPPMIIQDIKQAGGYLFCSVNTGIFRSSDFGKTWSLVFQSKDQTRFLLSVSGEIVYAVKGGGC